MISIQIEMDQISKKLARDIDSTHMLNSIFVTHEKKTRKVSMTYFAVSCSYIVVFDVVVVHHLDAAMFRKWVLCCHRYYRIKCYLIAADEKY